MDSLSILTPLNYHASSCGYCAAVSSNGMRVRTPNSSFSYGMWAHRLSPQMYQQLIDRGWDRSGNYLYLPDMDRTCCPQYAIRLQVDKFKPSKSMKRALNRFNRFVTEGVQEEEFKEKDVMDVADSVTMDVSVAEDMELARKVVGQHALDPTQIPCTDQLSFTSTQTFPTLTSTSAANKLPEVIAESKIRDASSLPANQKREKRKGKNNQPFDLHTSLSVPSTHPRPAHDLRTQLIPSNSDLYFKERFELYKLYQIGIHGEEETKVTESGFKRFLCESPIQSKPLASARKDNVSTDFDKAKLGSHHLLYWLDNDLIAFGVLDILPKGISSVYFVWKKSLARWRLGVYSALKEMGLVSELGLQYYVMGYYIHGCPKMRYKGQYFPSEVLDPDTHVFYPLEQVTSLLSQSKNSSFSGASRSIVYKTSSSNEPICPSTILSSDKDEGDSDDGLPLPNIPGTVEPDSPLLQSLLMDILFLEPGVGRYCLVPLELSKTWNMESEGRDERRLSVTEAVRALGTLSINDGNGGMVAFWIRCDEDD